MLHQNIIYKSATTEDNHQVISPEKLRTQIMGSSVSFCLSRQGFFV